MAKSGLKHIDVGSELTKTGWESEESHELLHGNSFPGSPVERQLFYRDDEHKWYIHNGTTWAWLGGGSGMSLHGNEYHDPDFADVSHTHSDLSPAHKDIATGVHGVGASTVESTSGSQAKVDAHKDLTTGVHGVGSNHLAVAPAASHLVRTFTKGWTSGKLLKGAGVGADPTEISGWEKIAEVVPGSSVDYVDLNSLDINTDKFYKLFLNIENPLGSDIMVSLYRNGDYTESNYYSEWLWVNGTSMSCGRQNNAYIMGILAGFGSLAEITIARDNDGYMHVIDHPTWNRASGIGFVLRMNCSANTTSDITCIRIASGTAGGIGAGSVLMLCRPRSA